MPETVPVGETVSVVVVDLTPVVVDEVPCGISFIPVYLFMQCGTYEQTTHIKSVFELCEKLLSLVLGSIDIWFGSLLDLVEDLPVSS
jgi:hypothetical protein